MKGEGRIPTSSIEVFLQSSTDCHYISHRSIISTVLVILEESDAASTLQEEIDTI